MPPLDGLSSLMSRRSTHEPVNFDSEIVFKKTMIEQHKLQRQAIVEQTGLDEVDLKNCGHIFTLHAQLDDLSKELEKEKDPGKISEIENLYEQAAWEFQSTPFHDELLKIYELDYYISLFEHQLIGLEQRDRVRQALRVSKKN